jgi:hypothetical protein
MYELQSTLEETPLLPGFFKYIFECLAKFNEPFRFGVVEFDKGTESTPDY